MASSGPAIMFEDCLCAWTGDEMMMHGTLHFEKHLTFTASLKSFNRKAITLKNVGTSAIYYSWENLHPETTFDNLIPQRKIEKFFFNFAAGVLIPDTSKEIIITFYSREPGLFNETWQFSTKPVLCGGANIWLRLRGASVDEKNYQLEIARTECDPSCRTKECRAFYRSPCNRKRLAIEGDFKSKKYGAGYSYIRTKPYGSRVLMMGGKDHFICNLSLVHQLGDSYKAEKVVPGHTRSIILFVQNELLHQQVIHIVRTILKQLLGILEQPSKVQVFEESDIFRDEKRFQLNNPQLNYHRDVIEELNQIYISARTFPRTWDLSFDTLESAVYENEKLNDRENVIEHVEALKEMLEHPRLIPLTMGSYHITYILWMQTIDKLVVESINIVRVMNCVIKTRKDLVIAFEKNMVAKVEDFEKSHLEDVIPFELCRLMRNDGKIREKYHETLYLLTYSILSEMVESMDTYLEDFWL